MGTIKKSKELLNLIAKYGTTEEVFDRFAECDQLTAEEIADISYMNFRLDAWESVGLLAEASSK